MPILNVADVCPDGTVTDPGTVTSSLLLRKLTTIPPAGAGPLRVTVPVKSVPPRATFAESVKFVNTVGWTVMLALSVPQAPLALTTAVVPDNTGVVETTKLPETLPAATVTLAGTWT